MALFQNSVIQKHLLELDQEKVNTAWNSYKAHFHNPAIQKNIRKSKEEQYQEGFLRDLFVNVLGYILNPASGFNLTTELKNIKDARKTDGAILKDEKALAVIELKGTDTTDLSKVEGQAFGYKNNQPHCKYVITSNFEKLRFYIDNAVDYEEFNLFTLSKEEFHLFWLCLSAESILYNLPKKIKEESLTEEEEITKQLYKDYSLFRNEIFENIQQNNPEYDKLTLFKKTQKLLDRFLFIFFAEDRLLLPPNSIRKIAHQWTTLKELDAYVPLFDRFKKYFQYMNTGYKGKSHDIFAYNGGLFAPDDILDNIDIDDNILLRHTKALSNYDFESEVSVNILGHIFEHSLNEIEEIQAEIEEGKSSESSISRRKKDGVFYTPKHITKYIVDHTVKTLCEEKKSELNLQEEEYEKERKNRKKETIQGLIDKLDAYRNWLLELKICDPACGSGAFLNQALEFLIAEHEYIDELQNKLLGNYIPFTNIENSILEKNLYGVDINEESVEIAKLSLWLRTAEKGRKLTSLNENIKCGNSLIDDPEVAGDKAFNWYESFPQVFEPKEKFAYHVVLTTHNSRTSHRMIDHKIQKGDPVELNLDEEIALTAIIGDIITENGCHCVAYNICKDHVHMILVCEEKELKGFVKTIKGKSSFLYQSKGFKPLGQPLWSQKFFHADMESWQVALLSDRPGYLFDDDRLANAISYIYTNREKHGLPDSLELRELIDSFTEEVDDAFAPEYKGGFDVVIGNPPYVARSINETTKKFINKKFITSQYQLELYVAFMEQGINLILKNGLIGYIVPNSWLKNMMMSACRKFVLNNIGFQTIVPNLGNVFPDASVETMIFIGIKDKSEENIKISEFQDQQIIFKHLVNQNRFLENDGYIFDVEINKEILPIIKKMQSDILVVGELFDVIRGINPYDKYTGQSPDIIKSRAYHSEYQKDESFVPELKGKHTSRYLYSWDGKHYISYGDWLAAPRKIKYFEGERIVFREILGETLVSTLVSEEFKIDRSLYIAKLEENMQKQFDIRYVLGILNSRLLAFYFRYTNNEFDNLFPKIRVGEFKKLPIKKISYFKQNELSRQVELMLNLNKDINENILQFLELLQSKFPIDKLSKKLQNWHELTFGEFLKELKKKKVKLSLSEEAEWMEYFKEQKEKALSIQSEINRVDREIDHMVYKLYGLSEEEIALVEGSV